MPRVDVANPGRALPAPLRTGGGRPAPAPGFRSALSARARPEDPAPEQGPPPVAAPWLRPEGAGATPPNVRGAVPAAAAAGDRLLVGGGARPEARLQFGHGPFAGTEIQVRAGPGGIEVLVLTTVASARQTLSAAMHEVSLRLERRGHRLVVRCPGPGVPAVRPR